MHKDDKMEFLPIFKDGNEVYAGFWRRLGAAVVDILVLIPFASLFHYLKSINISMAIVAAVINLFVFSIYSIYFNIRYGGTLGKLAVGIRITKPNGEKIGVREAFLRSSVDLAHALIFAILQFQAISQVASDAYLTAGYIERIRLLVPFYPAYSKYVGFLSDIWYWSEMIVLLLNKRKRALHDFIAGTVVIHKEYA